MQANIVTHLRGVVLNLVEKEALKHSLTHRLMHEFMTHSNDGQKAELIDAIREGCLEVYCSEATVTIFGYCRLFTRVMEFTRLCTVRGLRRLRNARFDYLEVPHATLIFRHSHDRSNRWPSRPPSRSMPVFFSSLCSTAPTIPYSSRYVRIDDQATGYCRRASSTSCRATCQRCLPPCMECTRLIIS